MMEILHRCEGVLAGGSDELGLIVSLPGSGCYDGEKNPAGQRARHLKTWLDLSEALGCDVVSAESLDESELLLRLVPLPAREEPWEASEKERYGPKTKYGRISKPEDPNWLFHFRQALAQCRLKKGQRVVVLGVARGDEVEVMEQIHPDLELEFIGIDHNVEALEDARRRFAGQRFTWLEHDISTVPEALSPCDLLVALATLQCSGFDGKAVFREWFQKALHPRAGVILGFPNQHYRGGVAMHGATMKNEAHPDMSLVLKDAVYYRKYLQTHQKRVTLRGKGTLFLTGSALGSP